MPCRHEVRIDLRSAERWSGVARRYGAPVGIGDSWAAPRGDAGAAKRRVQLVALVDRERLPWLSIGAFQVAEAIERMTRTSGDQDEYRGGRSHNGTRHDRAQCNRCALPFGPRRMGIVVLV